MARSSKKGPYVDPKLLKKIERLKAEGKKTPIRTWARHSSIAPEMVGYTFEVHNGRDFIPVFITEAMVGHKLGEFSPTRKFVAHSKKGYKKPEQKE
ncbi:MAG: 30S ribosomal protein S19 [Candidatus Cloacimonetes bacterium]|nr:30S ribosomal protein S19 [Candidatus Cloacimonadota bacterium]